MQKQYKLAYFVSHPIQYQAPLLKLLAEQPDIDLHVFFLCNPTEQNYTDKGFEQTIIWDVPLLDGYQYTLLKSTLKQRDFSICNPLVSLKSVRSALKSNPWDAVWVHGYNNLTFLYIIWKCFRIKIPLLFRGESTLLCSRQSFLKNKFIRWLIKNSTGLLWIGEDNREYYRHYGAKDRQLFFTPYAVDNAYFQTKNTRNTSINAKSERCVLLFASKFIKRKQAPLLLNAFYLLEKPIRDKAELWFVGHGEEHPLLEKQISELKLNNQVFLKGFINQSELPNVIAQCDVFILPSEKEPFGLIVNEAMNLAKPIITTNEVGAAKDLVTHHENGWVIPARDVNALTNTLREAISDRNNLAKMGQLSLEKINKWSYKEDVEGIRLALKSTC